MYTPQKSTVVTAWVTECRAANKRTAICDRESWTIITSDDRQVEFSRGQWAWIDAESGKKVVIGGGIQWITLRDE